MQLMCHINRALGYSCLNIAGLATEGRIETRSLPSKLGVTILCHLHTWYLDRAVVLELTYPLSVPLLHKIVGKKEP